MRQILLKILTYSIRTIYSNLIVYLSVFNNVYFQTTSIYFICFHCLSTITSFLKKYLFLTVLGLSYGMKTVSCSMYDLVP